MSSINLLSNPPPLPRPPEEPSLGGSKPFVKWVGDLSKWMRDLIRALDNDLHLLVAAINANNFRNILQQVPLVGTMNGSNQTFTMPLDRTGQPQQIRFDANGIPMASLMYGIGPDPSGALQFYTTSPTPGYGFWTLTASQQIITGVKPNAGDFLAFCPVYIVG